MIKARTVCPDWQDGGRDETGAASLPIRRLRKTEIDNCYCPRWEFRLDVWTDFRQRHDVKSTNEWRCGCYTVRATTSRAQPAHGFRCELLR